MLSSSKPRTYVEDLAVNVSHTVATLAEVLDQGQVVLELQDDLDGDVTLDAQAEARGRFSLSVAGREELIPTSPGDPLAPYGNEIRLSRGIEYHDRIELVRLGTFRIDDATPEDGDDGITIDVSGVDRSGRFMDALFEQPGNIEEGTLVTDAILQVLLPIWPDMPHSFTATTVELPALHFEEGDDRWSFANDLAVSIGGELYWSRYGTLLLRPIPALGTSFVKSVLQEGEGGVLLSATRKFSREQVSNKVIVTGESASLGSAYTFTPRGVATDLNPWSPTYYYGKFGRKPFFWPNSYIVNDVQAKDAANGLLARVSGAPDSVEFDTVVDPTLSPSDVVLITREAMGIDEQHILDSITIPLSAESSMTGSTRATAVIPS